MPVIAETVAEALAPIGDGIMLAVPREVAGVPMEATRALIRRGVRDLHLVALPTSSLQADLLIGAGCVAVLETSAVSLGELGPAPRFTAAIKAGAIRMMDATCPALHAAFQAAERACRSCRCAASSAPTFWRTGPTGASSTIRSAPLRSYCCRRIPTWC
jgi:glutaconate CoA-transferase subunit A